MTTDSEWAKARVDLIERAAVLDDQMSLSLALHLGREEVHVLVLLQQVMWRVPVDARIDLLADALSRAELDGEVPVLIEALRAVFKTRNSLAHSVTFSLTETTTELRTVRRGRQTVITISFDHLVGMVQCADACQADLSRIEGRIGAVETWGRLYGFQPVVSPPD